jgi:hypothetical protein
MGESAKQHRFVHAQYATPDEGSPRSELLGSEPCCPINDPLVDCAVLLGRGVVGVKFT